MRSASAAAIFTPPGKIQERRHDRFVVELPAIFRLRGNSRGSYLGTVLDVSRTGLRINCPTALLADTPVEITCINVTIEGTVRYARECDPGFHLGIEAQSAVRAGKRFEGDDLDLMSLFPLQAKRPGRT